MILRALFFVMTSALVAAADTPGVPLAITRSGAIAAPEAGQAAAADGDFVFAIDSAVVAKYPRKGGDRLALSTGEAKHLNSGFVWEHKVYCAHSNYPRKPEKSEIKVLDPETMVLSQFHDFGDSNGSLTWAVKEGDAWWCTFAFYGDDNARTRLVKYDAAWKQIAEWTYPAEVVKDLGKYSISGGIWRKGKLLVTGHDHRVVYRLEVPENGGVLKLLDVLPSPFPGQGIAADPVTGGLIGIDRGRKDVVFAELRD